MSENTTAVRRTKDTSSTTNGTRRSVTTATKSSHTSQSNSHSIRSGDSDIDPDSLTLWHHPIKTLNFFLQELLINIVSLTKNIFKYKVTVWSAIIVAGLFLLSSRVAGPQQAVSGSIISNLRRHMTQIFFPQLFKSWEANIIWWFYWIGLGVLSSVGLGTGLHTFVLYLGPHIASVTMAAYECGGLNFPEPPYPDQIICPSVIDAAWTASVLNIMRKVRVEAMLWGAGTALGELPPYFMARAARLSRQTDKDHDQGQDQEELKELEALEAIENGEKCVSLAMRAKLAMKHFVQKAGFLGILACASVSFKSLGILQFSLIN